MEKSNTNETEFCMPITYPETETLVIMERTACITDYDNIENNKI